MARVKQAIDLAASPADLDLRTSVKRAYNAPERAELYPVEVAALETRHQGLRAATPPGHV